VNFTATLLAQIITFGVLVWFVQRFLWGPLTSVMEARKKKIADGLAAGERGLREQALAEERAKEVLHEAKAQASDIIQQAQKRAGGIVDEAKQDARAEGERLLTAAKAEIEQEANRAREDLRHQVAQLAVIGAGKVLEREVDAAAHKEVLDRLAANI
jgi:F-type H+-transporting ATPase subunit b